MTEFKHCCQRFSDEIEAGNIEYVTDERGWSVVEVPGGDSYAITGMLHCPWCGGKLEVVE